MNNIHAIKLYSLPMLMLLAKKQKSEMKERTNESLTGIAQGQE